MITEIGTVCKALNTLVGTVGAVITIRDHFSNNTNALMRTKSKLAYDQYCEYRNRMPNLIGQPQEDAVLDYWNTCLQRNTLPCVSDIVSQGIADINEAGVLFNYLMEAWMSVLDFSVWLRGLLIDNKLENLASSIQNLSRICTSIYRLIESKPRCGQLLVPNNVYDARCACTDSDVEHYFMVDSNYNTMLRVISSENDIPHLNACEKLAELIKDDKPIIITGNSGSGKTSLMLRIALQWVAKGRVAVWLSLSSSDTITAFEAHSFYQGLLLYASEDQEILLCIDNPYENKYSFANLQKEWPANTQRIKLITAERENRLSILADSDEDYLFRWFDNANLLILQGIKRSRHYSLKNYTNYACPDTLQRRKEILDKCTGFLKKKGLIDEETRLQCVQHALDSDHTNLSVAELIYRTLFELKANVSKFNIKLDWNEWQDLLKYEFPLVNTKNSFGIIAAFKLFNSPMPISLFCRYFNLHENTFYDMLNAKMLSQHIEPVIYQKGSHTLQPKHNIIAKLFFLFNQNKVSINNLMTSLLKIMKTNEIEALLSNMVSKKEMCQPNEFEEPIAYREYMNIIYNRVKQNKLSLSNSGKAFLCLGFLWSRYERETQKGIELLSKTLTELSPDIEDSLPVAKAYTEWGIWAHCIGNDDLAKEKLRLVINNCPTRIPPRTELGRILARESGSETEAERCFREVIEINPKHIQSRTELGKLLGQQKERMVEAESVLKEALDINPRNIPTLTEMGRLLAKQKGREEEAEEYLHTAIKIDSKHIQSRTELGRLLARQKGKEVEAEKHLRIVIDDHPNHCHSRIELGKLLARQEATMKEAEKLFLDVLSIDPNNLHAHTELGRLLARQDGRKDEAERYLLRALQINPSHLHSRTELGILLSTQEKRKSEAERYFREAFTINPSHLHSRIELGRLLALQNTRIAEAEMCFQDVLRIDPNNFYAHYELGCFLQTLEGREKEAEVHLNKAEQIDPEKFDSLRTKN